MARHDQAPQPRFHVDVGPSSLFERVRQVFAEPRVLRLHGIHYNSRADERSFPSGIAEHFVADEWDLMTVEVRPNGKFARTAWRREIDGRTWWMVIGFNDTVQTVYSSSPGKRGLGPDVVRSGELFNLVDCVNRDLVDTGAPPSVPPFRGDSR